MTSHLGPRTKDREVGLPASRAGPCLYLSDTVYTALLGNLLGD